MKKRIYLLAITTLLCLTAFNSKAAVAGDGTDMSAPLTKEEYNKLTPEQKQAHAAAVKAKITEIESIDASKMSKEDRKALRKELKALRHDSSTENGGAVAVEVGGGVVILVLVGLLSGV